MAFNGSGTFNRLYSWVTDAANGVNIDATRMDNETNGIATALSNCVTRDGQSPFLANVPAGGFKITGLGTPSSTTDAATKAYVDGVAATEWVLEAHTVAFVSTTSFKVVGVNVASTYAVGRRVKIVHNTGGTTTYATITAVAFVTDTTITVATDAGVVLVSTVTAVSYGLLSYANSSYLDPRSHSLATGSSDQTYVASSGFVKVAMPTERYDLLGDYDAANSQFVVVKPGIYLATFNLWYVQASLQAPDIRASIFKNGGIYASQRLIAGGSTWVALSEIDLTCQARINAVAGDYFECYVSSAVGGGTVTHASSDMQGSTFAVDRLL